MPTAANSRSRLCCSLGALLSVTLLAACGGTTNSTNHAAGTLVVAPSSLNFGNVAVGSSSSLKGTLSAKEQPITISTADWSGSGYSISGITFPATIPAAQTVTYTVTFTPPAAGGSAGSVSFISNASDLTLTQSFTGAGTQTIQHKASLSWNPSTSNVAGYNVYRGTHSGGPYSTKLNSSLLSATSFTDSNVQSGATYFYVTTAVDSNNVESAYSNQAQAAIP